MLRRLRAVPDNESGAAMVMVLGIMMVGAVLLATLVTVTLANVAFTAKTQAEMHAFQSADAGIDLVLSQLEDKTYAELASVCDQDFVINNDQVDVSFSYTLANGTKTDCPGATDIVTALTVTATATTSTPALNGEPVVRSVVARFNPTPPEVLLDKAIFSEGTSGLTNGSQLLESASGTKDAHWYSNGGITCETQEVIQGRIIAAHGDVQITNACEIGSSVWASGGVHMLASGALIDGDVYAAGTKDGYGVLVNNSQARITGSILTNGNVRLVNAVAPNGGVGATVVSLAGSVSLEGGSTVGGSVLAKSNVAFVNHSVVNGNVYSIASNITRVNGGTIKGNARAATTIDSGLTITGTRTPSASTTWPDQPNPPQVLPPTVGYPTAILPPSREAMPQLTMHRAEDIQKWTGAGWNVTNLTGVCSSSQVKNALSKLAWIEPELVYFAGCSGAVDFGDNLNLSLTNDLAVVSDTGFNYGNDPWFRSSPTTDQRTLYVIVPADAPTVSWNAVPGWANQTSPTCSGSNGNIVFNNKAFQAGVKTLFYTPCKFQMNNGNTNSVNAVLVGQVYAGQVTAGNAWYTPSTPMTALQIKMASIPVPSLSSGTAQPGDPAEMSLVSRYDLRG